MRRAPWFPALLLSSLAGAAGADWPAAAATDNTVSPEQQQYETKLRALNWIKGPANAPVPGNSTLVIPEGYVFLDAANTDKFNELNENIPDHREVLVAPRDLHWSAYLSFDDGGYVKDNEKIDAPALLKTLKQDVEDSNSARQARGWKVMHLVDWAAPPSYNRDTRQLEWAILLQTGERRNANYLTKILGRRGHTTVVLAGSLDDLAADEADLASVLHGYRFNAGETYADWRPGDKVAEYGLAALILGGAAAVATKKGFWAVLAGFFAAAWKLIAAAVVGAGAWLRSLFKKKA
jgi:uncharacterized membrane-anchored protein